jgi:hypothetical protein
MTIAEANVNLQLALPEGWTKADIESELNDILTALQDKIATDRGWIVEFDTNVLHADADPLQSSKVRSMPKSLTGLQTYPTPLPLAMR